MVSARARARALALRPRALTARPTDQCSYNSVNGQPSCANEWLLKTVLRETWQFDGCAGSRRIIRT